MCTLRNVTLRQPSSSCFPSQLHVASPASCGLSPDIPACSPWHLHHSPSQPGSHPPSFVSGGLYACVTNSPRMDLGRKLETGFLRVPSQCTQGLSHPRAWLTSAPEVSLPLLLVETEVWACTPVRITPLLPSCGVALELFSLSPPQPHTPVCTHLHKSKLGALPG